MKPTDLKQKSTAGSRFAAVLAGLLGGSFAGFWAGVLFLQALIQIEPSVGGSGPWASVGTGILGLCYGIIGALLGGVGGAALGLRGTSSPTDPVRANANTLLMLSVTVGIGLLVTGLFWALGKRPQGQRQREQDANAARQSELKDQQDAALIDDWIAGRTHDVGVARIEDRLRWVKNDVLWSQKIPPIDDDKLLLLIELLSRQGHPRATQALMVELQNPQRSEAVRIACLKSLMKMLNYNRYQLWSVLDQLGPNGAFLMPALAESLGEGRETDNTWYEPFFEINLIKTLERLGPTAAPVAPVLEAAIQDMEKKNPNSRNTIIQCQQVLRALRGVQSDR